MFDGLLAKRDPANQVCIGDNNPSRYGLRVQTRIHGKWVTLVEHGLNVGSGREDIVDALGPGDYRLEVYYKHPRTDAFASAIQRASLKVEDDAPLRAWTSDSRKSWPSDVSKFIEEHNREAALDAEDERADALGAGGGDPLGADPNDLGMDPDDPANGGRGGMGGGRRDGGRGGAFGRDPRDARGQWNRGGRDPRDMRGGGQPQSYSDDPPNVNVPSGFVYLMPDRVVVKATDCENGRRVWNPTLEAWTLHSGGRDPNVALATTPAPSPERSIAEAIEKVTERAGGSFVTMLTALTPLVLGYFGQNNTAKAETAKVEAEARALAARAEAEARAEASRADAARVQAEATKEAARLQAEATARVEQMRIQADVAKSAADAQRQQMDLQMKQFEAMFATPKGPSTSELMAQWKAEQAEKDARRDREMEAERRERDKRDFDREMAAMRSLVEKAKDGGNKDPMTTTMELMERMTKFQEKLGIKTKPDEPSLLDGAMKDPAKTLEGASKVLDALGAFRQMEFDGKVRIMEAEAKVRQMAAMGQGPQVFGATVSVAQPQAQYTQQVAPQMPMVPTEALPPTAYAPPQVPEYQPQGFPEPTAEGLTVENAPPQGGAQ
jgi:hypothetical protein